MSKPDLTLLDLEVQYQKYLDMVSLKESEMGSIQKRETKRAFFGGCIHLLVLFRDTVGEIEDEDRAILHLEDLMQQAEQYWKEEIKNHKST